MATVLRRAAIGRRDLFQRLFAFDGEASEHWIRVHRRAMACRFEVTLPAANAGDVSAAREALDEADRVESALTVFRESSALAAVNRRAREEPVAVDGELFALLLACRDLHSATDGAFDITSTPLSRGWGFLARQGRVPSRSEVEAALAAVGMRHVDLDSAHRTVRFRAPGVELSMGAIGKGYALGRMALRMRAAGVRHALLSAGGSSVLALGGRGRGFRVAVRSAQTKSVLACLHLRDVAMGTSGAGEQFVEQDGRRYGHVIDPRTGWPTSGVLAATVLCADPAAADALSTAFLVAGPDLARRYCEDHPGTLAFVTLGDGRSAPLVFGRCAGVTVEDLA